MTTLQAMQNSGAGVRRPIQIEENFWERGRRTRPEIPPRRIMPPLSRTATDRPLPRCRTPNLRGR
jgi:hypothetical protein